MKYKKAAFILAVHALCQDGNKCDLCPFLIDDTHCDSSALTDKKVEKATETILKAPKK